MNNVIVVKRDGTQVPYDRNKIICAINKALLEVDGNNLLRADISDTFWLTNMTISFQVTVVAF